MSNAQAQKTDSAETQKDASEKAGQEPSKPSKGAAPTTSASLPLPWAIAMAVGSGYLSIAIEVQWVRALALSFPATVYVFALVLSAYLVGIGAGAIVVGRVFQGRAPTVLTLAEHPRRGSLSVTRHEHVRHAHVQPHRSR